jgi:hypothetical protein
MVQLPNAPPDPKAMMIKLPNTALAQITMLGPVRLPHLTLFTPVHIRLQPSALTVSLWFKILPILLIIQILPWPAITIKPSNKF